MKSIIRFKKVDNIEELLMAIQTVTRGHIESYVDDGYSMSVTIVHHSSPYCPSCGSPVHAYGHGLCRNCWIDARYVLKPV